MLTDMNEEMRERNEDDVTIVSKNGPQYLDPVYWRIDQWNCNDDANAVFRFIHER